MRVLVVGSGGREHALCWKLAASPLLDRLWCAPGNPGIAELAECVPIGALELDRLVAFAREQAIDLVVPGPEAPLVAGLADRMEAAGIRCIGPSAAAARLEGSKSFMREVAMAAGIACAVGESFEDAAAARAFIRSRGAPVVVKADGLAAGKGVVVAATIAEAEAAVAAFMEQGALGAAGSRVVIEECLVGREVSLFALCDGAAAIALGAAVDHKRVGEGDTGPNTGGMGAVSPPPGWTAADEAQAMERIIRPTLAEMAARGTPFRGVLFAGLMLTAGGPKLLEFNVRFGDPECQVLLPRLRSDLLAALVAACEGELADFDLRWADETAVAVVLAAPGYPASPARGLALPPLPKPAGDAPPVFHAGTALEGGRLVSAGGRVLDVCAEGRDLAAARRAAYIIVDAIGWAEGYCRRDIGAGAAIG